jgi:hypothetical protein
MCAFWDRSPPMCPTKTAEMASSAYTGSAMTLPRTGRLVCNQLHHPAFISCILRQTTCFFPASSIILLCFRFQVSHGKLGFFSREIRVLAPWSVVLLKYCIHYALDLWLSSLYFCDCYRDLSRFEYGLMLMMAL